MNDAATDNAPLKIEEKPKTVSKKRVPNKNRRYIGTGIIGLKQWHDSCSFVGTFSICIGIVFLAFALKYGMEFAITGGSLIMGGTCYFAALPFIKALITIVKAAKLYIDNNK